MQKLCTCYLNSAGIKIPLISQNTNDLSLGIIYCLLKTLPQVI